jgi:hypothetical protein
MATLKVIFFLLPEIVKLIRNLSAMGEEMTIQIRVRTKLNAINNAFQETDAQKRAAALDAVFNNRL